MEGGLAGEEEREEDAGGDDEGGEEEDWVWEEDDGKAVAGLEEEGLVSGGGIEEAEGDADEGPAAAGLPEAEEGLVATDAAVGTAGALDRREEGWLGLKVLLTGGV